MENKQATIGDVLVWMNYVPQLSFQIDEVKRKERRAQIQARNVKHRSTLTALIKIIALLEKEKQAAILERQRVIDKLDEPNRGLLTSRYLLCKHWRDVAEDINYIYDYTNSTLHRRAIAAATECINSGCK